MSENSGVLPVTSTPAGTAARRSATRSGVRSSVGPERRLGLEDPQRSVGRGDHGGDRSDVVAVADLAGQRGDLGAVDAVGLRHEQHRAVGAGSVLVGDQVVGLAGGEVGRLRRGVLRPGAHAQRGCGEREQHDHGQQRPGERTTADAGGPASHHRDAGALAAAAHPAGEQPAAGQPAQGGNERERGEGDRDDGDRGGEPEGVVGRQPGQLEAEQRDQHGGRGEDHGATRGGDRAAGRLALVVPGAQELHVPGDQQQRVVDADTERDHRGHGRCRGADVHDRRRAG